MATLLLTAYKNTPSEEREAGLHALLHHLRFKERLHVQQVISDVNDPFSSLPLEILICIFDHLHPLDAWTQRLVCHRWRSTLSLGDFEGTALTRLESQHPSDAIETHKPGRSCSLRLRRVLALRLGLPFFFRETRANFATAKEPRTVREYALKGQYFAYLRGKRDESNTVVVQDLVHDVSTTLGGDARERLFALALSQKVVAFSTYQGSLYVATLPLTGQAPSRIRLPSSAIVALAADDLTVAALLHTSSERTYTVLVCEVESLRTSSFRFQADLVYDAEGVPHHRRVFSPGAMLVHSSDHSIDIFSSAYITVPSSEMRLPNTTYPPLFYPQLVVKHNRISFSGEEQKSSSFYVEHDGIMDDPGIQMTQSPFILGEVYSTGRHTEYGVDINVNELTWTIMFDSGTTSLYQPPETLKDRMYGMTSNWFRYRKDRAYAVVPGAKICVYPRGEVDKLGADPLSVIPTWLQEHTVLLMNDTFMVIFRPGTEFLKILIFDEEVTAQSYVRTGFWPPGTETADLKKRCEDKMSYL